MQTMDTQSTVASLTVLGRLMRTRAIVGYAALVLLCPILVALTVWQGIAFTSQPDVGLVVNDLTLVEGFDERWDGVKKGDRVVALDGQPVRDPRDWVARAAGHDATPLVVTFARGDKQFVSSAQATPLRAVDQLAIWARVLTGTLLMVMGLLLFVLRPGTTVTWLFLALALALGSFCCFKIAFWWDPRLDKQVSGYNFMGAMSVGLHLFNYFPQRLRWLRDKPWRALWLYLPLIVGPLVSAIWGVAPLSWLGTLAGAGAAVGVVVIMLIQNRQLRASSDAQARSQYRALLVGFTGGLALPGIWNWLRISFGVGAGPWAAHYNALPLLLFVGVTGYSVVRHNALAIDRFTAAVVGYGVTTVILGGAFAGLLFGIPMLLEQQGLGESRALLVLVTGLTFAGFAPLYRRVKRWVDRRFFREQADAARIADTLRELVLTLQQSSRDEAVSAALEAAEILNPDRVEFWLLTREDNQLRFERGTDPEGGSDEPLPLDGPLGQALRKGAAGGVEGLVPRTFESAAQEQLWSKELIVAAPLMVRGVLAGFLGVGRKRSGVSYQLDELSFLSIVAAQLASAVERAQTESSKIDRYHLERRLGTGGMAEVFLAWQVGPGGFERKVAIKRPLPHVSEDPNAVAAFLDEARLAAQLQNSNIAQVHDVGESDGSYFIVMEYVDGPSLRQILRKLKEDEQRMPLGMAMSIIGDVLAALEYAHARTDESGRSIELVHRDVTPRNVLLNRHGQAKLVDFGIARAEHRLHVTRTGVVKGTLPYMSAEQAYGAKIDGRGDIYSAAVLFYEMLTNQMPFPGGPARRRAQAITKYAPDLPVAIDAVVLRAMSYEADKRYGSAGEMQRALVQAIHPQRASSHDEVAGWLSDRFPDLLRTETDRMPSSLGPDDIDSGVATQAEAEAAETVAIVKQASDPGS
ncbi:MAG TPA: protein kinase [Polyangiaceae bacterium]|nr:protein kinase [Polyangiaceae bacterium]